ncbi:uncharacterized protein LOC118348709 [Juglans regia]|uniref:Uncharacterized protein LOC118348709 n=1 Tax=Juglans regia TaxID=51240 RepID=A0A6P9EHB3_JUGRE|nr:uncharacterized protein LOC118348709 [Juglans regia]
MELVSTEVLLGHLLAHESRLQHHADNVALFSSHEPSANYYARGSSGRNRGVRGRHNGNINCEGRTHSNRGRSTSGYSGNPFPVSSINFTNNRPVCQVCNRMGHIVLTCLYHFNQAYTASAPPLADYSSSTPSFDGAWYSDTATTNHVTSELANMNLQIVEHYGD